MPVSAGTVYVDIAPQVAKSFGSDLKREIGDPIDDTSKRASGSIGGVATKLAGVAAGAFAGLQVASFFKGAIDGASNLNESLSKVNTVFGKSGAEIDKWAKGAAESVGLSRGAALDAAGAFGNMFTQLGIGAPKAADMSKSIVGLAADFASFHNADISEVIDAQSAAFRGEYDSLQRFLPLINGATVEQKAMEMTGKANAKALTAQEKALAVNALMLSGAGKAAGDFARTSDGLANKQRILAARFENIKTSIGSALLPIVLNLTTVFAENLGPVMSRLGELGKVVVDAITKVANAFKFLFEDGDPQGFAEILDNLLGNSGQYIGFFSQFGDIILKVAGFIGDNLKPILIGLGVAVAALVAPFAAAAAAVVFAYTQFETFRNVVKAVVDFLVDVAAPAVADFAGYIIDQFSNLVAWVQQFWPQISEAIGHVLAVIEGVVRTTIAVVSGLWRQWGDDLFRMAQSAFEFIRGTIDNVLQVIRGIIQTVLALINGDWGKAWDGIKGILAGIWDQITNTVRTAIDGIKSLLGGLTSTMSELFKGAADKIVEFLLSIPGRIANLGKDILSKLMPDIPGGGILKSVLGKIPGLASGGIVTQPTLAWIGEREAEAVIPLSEMRGSGLGGPLIGGDFVVQQTNPSPAAISAELAWLRRTSGR